MRERRLTIVAISVILLGLLVDPLVVASAGTRGYFPCVVIRFFEPVRTTMGRPSRRRTGPATGIALPQLNGPRRKPSPRPSSRSGRRRAAAPTAAGSSTCPRDPCASFSRRRRPSAPRRTWRGIGSASSHRPCCGGPERRRREAAARSAAPTGPLPLPPPAWPRPDRDSRASASPRKRAPRPGDPEHRRPPGRPRRASPSCTRSRAGAPTRRGRHRSSRRGRGAGRTCRSTGSSSIRRRARSGQFDSLPFPVPGRGPTLREQLGIRGYPTIVFLKDGVPVEAVSGVTPAARLEAVAHELGRVASRSRP